MSQQEAFPPRGSVVKRTDHKRRDLFREMCGFVADGVALAAIDEDLHGPDLCYGSDYIAKQTPVARRAARAFLPAGAQAVRLPV